MRYIPMRPTLMKYTPIRCMPINVHAYEIHAQLYSFYHILS
jgi:hypothetical protein